MAERVKRIDGAARLGRDRGGGDSARVDGAAELVAFNPSLRAIFQMSRTVTRVRLYESINDGG